MERGVNRRWVLGSLAGTAALAACATRKTHPRRRELALAGEIGAAIERALALDLVSAVGVGVYTRQGVYAKGSGFTDIDTRERASADTAFYVASSTKSMTALALSCLQSRGGLNLDSTLGELSPDSQFPAATRPAEVRLRDLLTHTSGITNEPIEHRFSSTGQHDPETLWRLLASSEPNGEAPLGRFQYANVGYNIATILTDRKLGVRWQDLLRTEVFDRAGMTRTSASMSRARSSRWSIARPHRLDAAGFRERSYLEKTDQTMHSAGGVIMSAHDATRWLELMIEDGLVGGRRCVPPEVVQATRSAFATVDAELDGYRREAYGLGWYIGPYRNERMVHHFGGFSGFRAHVSYLPEQAIGVAAFTNDSTTGLRVINAIANFVYDRAGGYQDAGERFEAALETCGARYREAVRRRGADSASRANLRLTLTRPPAAYTGVYENPLWGSIDIAIEDGTLRVTCGVLRALAQPLGTPDAVWVELEPGDGSVLQFDADGSVPASLNLEGERYHRA